MGLAAHSLSGLEQGVPSREANGTFKTKRLLRFCYHKVHSYVTEHLAAEVVDIRRLLKSKGRTVL